MVPVRGVVATLVLSACWLIGICGAVGFPDPFDSEADRTAAPQPAAAAAAAMDVPAGFHVGVFAAEPEVRNPIAMAWDARGRLWIAENHTYAERPLRLDSRLRDRVVVFVDRDGDGKADGRTVFLDDLQQLTSVEIGLGGVWLLCPPRLLFVPDADGDDVPDGPPRVLLDGFEVADENHHNFANGLRFGPDGWLYGRCGASCPGLIGPPGAAPRERVRVEGGIWRYAPWSGRFEAVCHGTTNPWGHDWNEWGDGFFINTVNGHLWQIIPGAHYHRPHTIDPHPHAYELLGMHADHWHFDTGAGWTASRDGAADDLGGGHAHSGMMIYLGDDWPAEYRGRLLTWNFHGRRANQELLEREGSGYVGRHGPDMLRARDPFFRGIDLSAGPDGAVYAIDWSDTGECHEATGVHRTSGRIFRISHGAAPVRPFTDLTTLADGPLAELMAQPNEWHARQARLELAHRAGRGPTGPGSVSAPPDAAAAVLRRLALGPDAVVACRAVLALHAGGGSDRRLLAGLLDHPDEHLRAWGVRLLADDWPLDGVLGPGAASSAAASRVAAEHEVVAGEFVRLAATDPSGLVRLALASTLQRLPVECRGALAVALMTRREDADDRNLPLLVWYGLIPAVEADPGGAADLAMGGAWPTTCRLIARRLAGLIERHPEGVDRLVAALATTADERMRADLLDGLAAGLAGWRRAAKPRGWDGLVERLGRGDGPQSGAVRSLSAVFGDGRALAEVREIVLDDAADAGLRRTALETLVRQGGDPAIRDICLRLLRDPQFQDLAAEGLAAFDEPAVAAGLIEAYGHFRSRRRPAVIGVLASRPTFAAALLEAVGAGRIPRDDLGAYDLRQIRSLGDPALDAAVEREWGTVAATPAEKRLRIVELRESLRPAVLATADLGHGRVVYERACSRCHRLFGAGSAIGPDLTGGQRTNVDYLLENLVDPGGVVARDYRLSVVRLVDGRVLNGLVAARDEHTLTLVTPTARYVLAAAEIAGVTVTPYSPMPEGLLDQLPPDAVRDLVAYLMQPGQVPAP